MTQTIPYVRDLRMTAATIAAQHIKASWHDRGKAIPHAVAEAALDAVAPMLVDAYRIEKVIADADEHAKHDPYRYLAEQQRKGELRLQTLQADEDDSPARP
ncbi:hypothetical protein [Phytohabitans houttuyneae]|uniref:Uncharacterized protein n=1 Tax=Phytohabitans houttuyneae TaxID=1076126 RepID=A0A6V8KNM2_9ACTN|nr:hypothetical protein [Phytohabitans houttuyneae]GFJ84990.1 hypothetical protein Phou_091700 [Phytohabitans houttuyneae]